MKFHFGSEQLVGDDTSELSAKFPDVNVYTLSDSQTAPAEPCVFVEESLEPQQVVEVVQKRNLRHIVQKNEGYFGGSLAAAGRLLQSRNEYFQSEYCFSTEPILKTHLISFAGPADKAKLKTESTQFIELLKSAAVGSASDAIIEELYMNAVIDAPREAGHKGIKVQDPVCELFLCQTESWLQISCADPYGSLAVTKLIARMNEVYTRGAGNAINLEGNEGAGLGCMILFEQSVCLILGVHAGKKTKVTCLIPLGISNRRRAEMKKSIHWLEI